MSKLREAAEEYVKAMFAFQLGPRAYSDVTTRRLIAAEHALLRATTGCEGLYEAAAELGVLTNWRDQTPRAPEPDSLARRSSSDQRKPRPRLKLKKNSSTKSGGFFAD